MMNYRKSFERCFDYISSHLTEDLSLSVLADITGYSPFHFCHIFRLYQELSPSEYIRKRRLYASLKELEQDCKILDIAIKYRFDTASGYTKSFHKMFGFTPTEYKIHRNTLLSDKDILTTSSVADTKPMPLNTKLAEIDSFTISGCSLTVDLDDSESFSQIAALWENYETSNLEEQLYQELNPHKHAEIGIMIKKDSRLAQAEYLLGVISKNTDSSKPWTNYCIPGGRYLVVTTPPVDMTQDCNALANTVKSVWQYLFSTWLPESEYEFDETRNMFEYYDERCHFSNTSVMDIYLPVK